MFLSQYIQNFDQNIKIDENLAHDVFPDATREWYKDMEKHVKATDNEQTKYLFNQVGKNKPFIKKIGGIWAFGSNYMTESQICGTLNNGLVRVFCPWNDGHGSLGLAGMDEEGPRNGGDINSTAYVSNKSFSKEKLKEYCWLPELKEKDCSMGTSVYSYTAHNVNIYFQASFLECWVRNYLNEAMKKVLK